MIHIRKKVTGTVNTVPETNDPNRTYICFDPNQIFQNNELHPQHNLFTFLILGNNNDINTAAPCTRQLETFFGRMDGIFISEPGDDKNLTRSVILTTGYLKNFTQTLMKMSDFPSGAHTKASSYDLGLIL